MRNDSINHASLDVTDNLVIYNRKIRLDMSSIFNALTNCRFINVAGNFQLFLHQIASCIFIVAISFILLRLGKYKHDFIFCMLAFRVHLSPFRADIHYYNYYNCYSESFSKLTHLIHLEFFLRTISYQSYFQLPIKSFIKITLPVISLSLNLLICNRLKLNMNLVYPLLFP